MSNAQQQHQQASQQDSYRSPTGGHGHNNSNNTVGGGAGGAMSQETVQYLRGIANQPASPEHLSYLAGNTASCMLQETNSQVCFAYLLACARHLPTAVAANASGGGGALQQDNSRSAASSSNSAVDSVAAFAAAGAGGGFMGNVMGAFLGGGGNQKGSSIRGNKGQRTNNNIHNAAANNPAAMEAEMKAAKQLYEIAEAIGNAVTRCKPKSLITESGILPVLARFMPESPRSSFASSSANTASAPGGPVSGSTTASLLSLPYLSCMQVEFLQASLSSEHYHFAEQCLKDVWPRVSSAVTVRHVLRYFYLRGMIHMGCHNWDHAVRCFWTCLSVPSTETVSPTTVAAWKKMILVQCLRMSDRTLDETVPLVLPNAAPVCLGRFLNTAYTSGGPSPSFGGGRSSAREGISSSGSTSAAHPGLGEGSSPSNAAVYQPEDTHEVMNMVDDDDEVIMQQQTAGSAPEQGAHVQEQQQHHHQHPSQSSSSPQRQNRTNQSQGVRVYMDLVQAFVKVDRSAFAHICHEHASLFAADENTIIVKQCEAELVRRQVYHVSRIFSVISLQHLASILGMTADQVRTLLMQISSDKVWRIEIKEDGFVVFPKLPMRANQNPSEHIEELMTLTKLMQKLDASVAATTKFQAILRKEQQQSSKSAAAASDAQQLTGPRGVEDI